MTDLTTPPADAHPTDERRPWTPPAVTVIELDQTKAGGLPFADETTFPSSESYAS
ncbi:hypothetical protein [Rubrivirga marina]|uniref:hypothetical protein n=1 Tax=Rubrivirga marina TaxID=1196024 RepID=UPI0015CD6F87|nr:hypothetical protein [Rubrivirga marina]